MGARAEVGSSQKWRHDESAAPQTHWVKWKYPGAPIYLTLRVKWVRGQVPNGRGGSWGTIHRTTMHPRQVPATALLGIWNQGPCGSACSHQPEARASSSVQWARGLKPRKTPLVAGDTPTGSALLLSANRSTVQTYRLASWLRDVTISHVI